MSFENYGLPKRWLDQCLKSHFSEDPSKSNLVNAPKYCSNLKDSLDQRLKSPFSEYPSKRNMVKAP